MKYKDILDDVLDGKFVSPTFGGTWIKIRDDGLWEAENGTILDVPKRYYSSDTWVVLVKPKEPNPSETIEFNDGLDDEELCHKKPTLLQAIEQKKIVPGDKIKFEGNIIKLRDDFCFGNDDGSIRWWSAKQWMIKDFDIIKPEPEILNAKEYISKEYQKSVGPFWRVGLTKAFNDGEANGILKEQLRIKEAIELIRKAKENAIGSTESYQLLEKALKILQGDKD